jgi:hypothetical protein
MQRHFYIRILLAFIGVYSKYLTLFTLTSMKTAIVLFVWKHLTSPLRLSGSCSEHFLWAVYYNGDVVGLAESRTLQVRQASASYNPSQCHQCYHCELRRRLEKNNIQYIHTKPLYIKQFRQQRKNVFFVCCSLQWTSWAKWRDVMSSNCMSRCGFATLAGWIIHA